MSIEQEIPIYTIYGPMPLHIFQGILMGFQPHSWWEFFDQLHAAANPKAKLGGLSPLLWYFLQGRLVINQWTLVENDIDVWSWHTLMNEAK